MKDKSSDILVSPREFFVNVVDEATTKVNAKTSDLSKFYLVDILEQFLHSQNLFEVDSVTGQNATTPLAELYLKATSDEKGLRFDLLKKLGDTSLYISGFFGDSLSRKLVDIDYYADMGGVAYKSLAKMIQDESYQELYDEIGNRFMTFVDVLTYISQRTEVQSDENLLRLYDRYVKTGSEVVKQQLSDKGIVVDETLPKKKIVQ